MWLWARLWVVLPLLLAPVQHLSSSTANSWIQTAYLKASNTESLDRAGFSAAVSANTIIIGAVGEASSATGVNPPGTDDSAAEAGAAYVYTRNAGVWALEAYLKASNTDAGDHFGWAVAISGDTLVVGAPDEDSANTNEADDSAQQAGAVYVFTRAGGVWSQQAYLKASNVGDGDNFGYSVAISGDTIVVGAYSEDSGATGVNGNQASNSAPAAGAAYVFVRTGAAWSQQAYLKASNTDAGDFFGFSVAVDGNTVVTSSKIEASSVTGIDGNQADDSQTGAGAAYVFVRSGINWSQQAYVKASNTQANDYFGQAVAISGDTLVVGAYGEDSSATGVNGDQTNNLSLFSGAAYVFHRTGTTWEQQAYLKAGNTDTDDQFGTNLSISGDWIVVCAPREESNATGVNGDSGNNLANGSGACYAFQPSGADWQQAAYLKASNTDPSDHFGWSVAVDGETIVIGAPDEDSNATLVNGDQMSDSAFSAGAGYAFTAVQQLFLPLAFR